MFSKTCEYGIKATLFIAQNSQRDNRVSLNEIAASIDSPTAFTAKILQTLVKENIIRSLKGPTGGFKIEKEKLSQITLKQIVKALDGDQLFKGCVLGLEICNEKMPCPMHHEFAKIRNHIDKTLDSSNLLETASNLDLGLAVLKR